MSYSGNPCLAWVLGKAAISAYKANLSGRALPPRRAIVTVGRFILAIIWHLLAGPTPLPGSGVWLLPDRIDTERRKRNHVRQLEALRYKVTLLPAA